ncbi:MAG: Panacea domain-containing protein [Microcystaceae cyanobacterium]
MKQKALLEIVFSFDDVKATQAAAYLLKLHGEADAMSYLGLLKLLYIGDRRSLEQRGYPITGDNFVAMKYGPVLSHIYDYVKPNGGYAGSDYWNRHIETIATTRSPHKKVYVTLIDDPGDDELSIAEEKILQGVYQEFGHKDPFAVAEWTHDLPEWQDPATFDKKVMPIDVQNLLSYLHKSDEEIILIKEIADRERYFNQVNG